MNVLRPAVKTIIFALFSTAVAVGIAPACDARDTSTKNDDSSRLSTPAESGKPGKTVTSHTEDTDALARQHEIATATAQPGKADLHFRIVSLSPAVTDILIDLELESYIVGRDRWEGQLPDDVPRVGDLTSFNQEAFIALKPTDVLVQAGRRGAPPGLVDLARTLDARLTNLQIDGLDDIAGAIETLTANLTFGHAPHLQAQTAANATSLLDSIAAALTPLAASDFEAAARLARRPVLLLHSLDPPQAFGPGSYLSDMLTRLGGANAVTTGGPWQSLDFESVVQTDPWAVILVSPATEVDWTPLHRLGIDAAAEHRLAILSHPQALLPGSSVGEVAIELRALLLDLDRRSVDTAGDPTGSQP